MGHKGVSKRKPKKVAPSSGAEVKGRSGEGSAVQSLMKEKGAPVNRDGVNPSTGSQKPQKKH